MPVAAVGNESFFDEDGNGSYSNNDGEPYDDANTNGLLDEPFIDANGNNLFDEPFIDTNLNSDYDFGAPFAALVLSGPVLAAMLLIYGRLLGRLAWRASGAAAAPRESGSASTGRETFGTSNRKKKKRRRARFEFPDELSLPADGIPDAPPIVNPRRRP